MKPSPYVNINSVNTLMCQLRESIRRVDTVIIEQLAQREQLSKQIGQLKLQAGIEITDLVQEKKMFLFYKDLCEKNNISKNFIMKLFKRIIMHSRNVQSL